MEKITNEIAEKAIAWFESDEVKALIAATEKSIEGDTGTFEVVITTENLDRYQEVVSLDGWELEHYLKNPVVLWGHDHFTLPIGMATSVEIRDGKMIAKGKFAPHEHAQQIRALYDAGIVRATSVGFIEKEREGNLITKAELLEFSFVSVPANPYALSLNNFSLEEVSGLVTKGIINLKDIKDTVKDTQTDIVETGDEDTTPQENAEEAIEPEMPEDEPKEEDQPTDEPELTDQVRSFAKHIVKEVIAAIKCGALEETETSQPEGTDDEEESGDDAEKALSDFEVRKKLQSIDTNLGEVLGELKARSLKE